MKRKRRYGIVYIDKCGLRSVVTFRTRLGARIFQLFARLQGAKYI